MRIGNTVLKATVMAAIIFWLILIPKYTLGSVKELMFLSLIPIFLCCLLAIVFTVTPFFWFHDNTLNSSQIFKIYFPYYAIVIFSICCFAIYQFNYAHIAIAYFTSAFFTLLQTWVWNSKQDTNEKA